MSAAYPFIRFIVCRLLPHPILDVVVDDEVQLLVCEAVVACEHAVDFVDDRFVSRGLRALTVTIW